MAANVETMFYSGREKPWHGLGVQLENPPLSEDAIVAGGLDWVVESRPLFDDKGVAIPGYRANVRTSDNAVLGVVSGRYTIVQNKEAFSFTDGLVNNGLRYETAGSLRGGKQIWLLGKMPETMILDDKLEPYICFTNTHDGTGSIRVCCTPIRVVCNNTLNLALKSASRSWSTRHIGNMESKLKEAQHTLGLIDTYISELQNEAEKLADISISDVTLEAMLDNIYPINEEASENRKAKIDNFKQQFFTCLDAPDIKKYRGSAWGAMMAVTDFADHSKPMRLTQNYEENRWGQIIVGHPFVDTMYKQIIAA